MVWLVVLNKRGRSDICLHDGNKKGLVSETTRPIMECILLSLDPFFPFHSLSSSPPRRERKREE